jgi:hypothetical protein
MGWSRPSEDVHSPQAPPEAASLRVHSGRKRMQRRDARPRPLGTRREERGVRGRARPRINHSMPSAVALFAGRVIAAV